MGREIGMRDPGGNGSDFLFLGPPTSLNPRVFWSHQDSNHGGGEGRKGKGMPMSSFNLMVAIP